MTANQRRLRVLLEAHLPGADSPPPLTFPVGPLKAAAVFAGAGLMDLGFQVEGFSVLDVVEFDPSAVDTLRNNLYPDATVTDANDWVCPPGLDVLFGGPPCQPYSKAGKMLGEFDSRDMLHHMVRWAREGRPRVICMENVADVMSARFAPYMEELLARMAAVGYQTVVWKRTAADYGSPQGRQRAFLVSWPKGAPWGATLVDAPPPTHGHPGSEAVRNGQLLPWASAFERLNEGCCGGFGYYSCGGLLNPEGVCSTCVGGNNYHEAPNENDGELSKGEVDYLARQLDRGYLKKERPSDLGGSFYGERLPAPGRRGSKLTWLGRSPTKGWQRGVPYGLKTTSESPGDFERWDAEAVATLERMSVREAAKLMDVPQWFQFYGSLRDQYGQVGNGVPVELARAVARHLVVALGRPVGPARVPQLWSDVCNYARVRAGLRALQGEQPTPVYFASGVNHAGEVRGFAELGQPFGVTVPKCHEDCLRATAETQGVPVFIDSGAYSEVVLNEPKHGKLPFPEHAPYSWVTVQPLTEQDWQQVLDTYDRLAAVLGTDLYVVAPDKIGHPEESLRRLRRYRDRLFHLRRRGVNIIVPLQGNDLPAYYRAVVKILGQHGYEFIPGVPSSKAAVPLEVTAAFVRECQPGRVHLLGMGPRAQAKAAEKGAWSSYAQHFVDVVTAAQPGIQVFMDSVIVAASRALRVQKSAQATAMEEMKEERWSGYSSQSRLRTTEGWKLPDFTDVGHEPSTWASPAGLRRLASKGAAFPDFDSAAFLADPDWYLATEHDGVPWAVWLGDLLADEWGRSALDRGGWEVAPRKQLGVERGIGSLPLVGSDD